MNYLDFLINENLAEKTYSWKIQQSPCGNSKIKSNLYEIS